MSKHHDDIDTEMIDCIGVSCGQGQLFAQDAYGRRQLREQRDCDYRRAHYFDLLYTGTSKYFMPILITAIPHFSSI